MTTHIITGVWKDSQKRITHVYLHTVNPKGGWNLGQKTTEAEAIKIVETLGNSVITKRWSYQNADWYDGAVVKVVKEGNNKYLRTVADAQISDNLDNMIRMHAIL